jgi:hypothetical protein
MQPSRQHCLWASLALLVFLMPAQRAFADTLTITSTPPGATVEIDGNVVGTTPYRNNFPGGYFHKTHTVFGAKLEHAMVLRISMEGYATQQTNLTEGPLEWIAITGRHEGTYFLLKSNNFNVRLVPTGSAGRIATAPGGDGVVRSAGAAADEKTSQDSAVTSGAAGDIAGTGLVTVRSEPSGADIFLDGKLVGETPSTLRLASGAHHVEVRSASHSPWVKDFDLLKGSEVTLRATFGEGESSGAVDSADDTSGGAAAPTLAAPQAP